MAAVTQPLRAAAVAPLRATDFFAFFIFPPPPNFVIIVGGEGKYKSASFLAMCRSREGNVKREEEEAAAAAAGGGRGGAEEWAECRWRVEMSFARFAEGWSKEGRSKFVWREGENVVRVKPCYLTLRDISCDRSSLNVMLLFVFLPLLSL